MPFLACGSLPVSRLVIVPESCLSSSLSDTSSPRSGARPSQRYMKLLEAQTWIGTPRIASSDEAIE